MKISKTPWLTKRILKSISQKKKMIFIGNLLKPRISIPKKFTTCNLNDTKA